VPASQRAYHPDEFLRMNGKLTIDIEWYLTNQILPPISRLCEPIDGLGTAIISNKMGLDASKFVVRDQSDGLDGEWAYLPKSLMDDADRFRHCKKLTVCCSACRQESEFKGPLTSTGSSAQPTPTSQESGLTCGRCGALFLGRETRADVYAYLCNKVTLTVRACMKDYYQYVTPAPLFLVLVLVVANSDAAFLLHRPRRFRYWLSCDDSSCCQRTMQQSAMGFMCVSRACHGRMTQDYTEAALHTQLKYLETLFDFARAETRARQREDAASGARTKASFAGHSAAAVVKGDLNGDLSVHKEGSRRVSIVGSQDQEVFKALKAHMSNSIHASAYNWVRPSLWTSIFGKAPATVTPSK